MAAILSTIEVVDLHLDGHREVAGAETARSWAGRAHRGEIVAEAVAVTNRSLFAIQKHSNNREGLGLLYDIVM